MRRPDQVERFYLDFDGFFASCEQLAQPALRGRPVGVAPFAGTDHTCVIAVSREAKRAGVKSVMSIREARAVCPDIVIVPQRPDLYRRAHNELISIISSVAPVDAIKSIDELTALVSPADRARPEALGLRIKAAIAAEMGDVVTCSIGYAANRLLAKMACKAGKPAGNLAWRPEAMPAPLLPIPPADVPGVGSRMARRLDAAGVRDMGGLLALAPKQMRALWGSVTGERMHYALHGYDVQAQPQGRAMYGHGRVLPPEARSLEAARLASRLLLTKAARRMRRDRWRAGSLSLWLLARRPWGPEASMGAEARLREARDDHSALAALEDLWAAVRRDLGRGDRVLRVGVTLGDLTRESERQLDMIAGDDATTRRWEAATDAIDRLNARYGRTLVSIGPWSPPPGGYAGGKISYTRIPSAEDFW